MASTTVSDSDINSLLSRLSTKASVQSVLVLSRDTGAIIRSTGSISRAADHVAAEYAAAVWKHIKACDELTATLEGVDETGLAEGAGQGQVREGEKDEVRLVRLRTVRRELVVVPDAKFILVVFHDTPPAP